MNRPHTQKAVSGSEPASFRNSSDTQRHFSEKDCDGSVSTHGGSSTKAYHQNSSTRLRQRRVCLPGFWVSHP